MSLYNGSVHNFTSLSPTMHNATVDFLTENVFLSINVFGKWILPDNTNYTHSQINYQVFTPMLCGIYHFVIIDIDGVEKMVMKIQIEAQGEIQFNCCSFPFYLNEILSLSSCWFLLCITLSIAGIHIT